jgi:hypothetical protein
MKKSGLAEVPMAIARRFNNTHKPLQTGNLDYIHNKAALQNSLVEPGLFLQP